MAKKNTSDEDEDETEAISEVENEDLELEEMDLPVPPAPTQPAPVDALPAADTIGYKDLKRNLKISFKENGDFKKGEIVSRAGKVASKKGKGKEGVYEHHWSIKDLETGTNS